MKRGLIVLLLALLLPSVSVANTLTGTWNNTTFGSFGDVSLDLSLTLPSFSITADFDGGVFGFGDPPPLILPGELAPGGDSATFETLGDPFFGDVTGALNLTTNLLTVDITNLPTTGPTPTGFNIFSTNLSGPATVDSMFNLSEVNLDYVVIFNCGGPTPAPCNGPDQGGIEGNDFALGVVNAVVPLPPAAFLFVSAFGLLGWMRRRST